MVLVRPGPWVTVATPRRPVDREKPWAIMTADASWVAAT